MYEKAPTPEPVAKTIIKAISTQKPKTRYKVGSDAKLVIMMKNLLSDKAFDKIIMNQMGIK